MAQVPFSVSARTARLIGRENVANAEGALIELVKNCYDADSSTAIVLVDKPNDTILILDSGDGMTDDIIREQWMTIGTDNKLNSPVSYKGRVKSGAKGIGRFALDRLGEKCTMITFPVHNDTGFQWDVNWGDFEEQVRGVNVKISEVYADLNDLTKTTFKKEVLKEIKDKRVYAQINKSVFNNGTLLKITGLRDEWRDDTIEKIYENLEQLTPPEGASKINIFLFNATQPGKYGLVPNSEFSDYDYKVVATYKKNAQRKIQIKIHRNEFDFSLIDKQLFTLPDMKTFPFDRATFKKEHFELSLSFKDIIKGFDDKRGIGGTIGDFEFTFYFLKHSFGKDDREKFRYKEILSDRSAWLGKFGGIKLYRDNFRVRPYGEINTPAYDWLMLGERFGQNPAGLARKGARIRPNQVAGIVKFSRLKNPYLEDKSSREGLQENDTFELFKNILTGIIKVQEDDRSTVGFNLNELYDINHPDEKDIADSESIAEEDDKNETQEETKAKNRTVKRGFKATQAKLKERDEELAISRALASAGIMIASFSHEFKGIKNDLSDRTTDLRDFLKPVINTAKLKSIPDRKNPMKFIDELEKQDNKIRQWIEFSIGLTKKDRRKNAIIDLKDYFDSFSELWLRIFEQRGVTLAIKCNRKINYTVKISELDLDTIFNNLITNSIEAFDRNGFGGEKNISIDLHREEAKILITYRDSGPGIPTTYKNVNAIFTPFETSKTDDLGNDIGTGLGMWLVKSAVDFNKGRIELVRPKRGFEIKVYLRTIKK